MIPLIIGVILINAAELIFTSEYWDSFNDIEKIIAIELVGAVFAAAFLISHFKLKLPNTSKAFYILAATSLSISLMGINAILNPVDHSIHNLNTQVFAFIMPSLTLLCASVFGYLKLYHSLLFVLFAWLSGYGLICAITTLFSVDYAFVIPAFILPVALGAMCITKRSVSNTAVIIAAALVTLNMVILALSDTWDMLHNDQRLSLLTLITTMNLAAVSLTLKKCPGIFCMLTTWTLSAFWGTALCLNCLNLDKFQTITAITACTATALCYGIPALSHKLSEQLHNKTYCVCTVLLALSTSILLFDDDYMLYPLIFSVIPLGLGIFKHLTRYIVLFAIIASLVALPFIKDAIFYFIPGWLLFFLIGAVLVGIAVANEIKRRRGKPSIIRIKPKKDSSWHW